MTVRAQSMLVLLAQQGDREALNDLLERVQAPLFRYIRGILCSDTAASEDVLQETLLRIALKRQSRRPIEEPVDDELPAGDPPPLSIADVSTVIEALSPARRAVLLLEAVAIAIFIATQLHWI